MNSDKVIHTRLTPTLLAAIHRKAGARGMTRSEYVRSLVAADCERIAPIPAADLLALVQVVGTLSSLPFTPELATIREAVKQYIKANEASWKS